jgi:hypothetical protein
MTPAGLNVWFFAGNTEKNKNLLAPLISAVILFYPLGSVPGRPGKKV